MSIELKQAALDAAEAIDWLLKNIRLDTPQLSGKAMGNAEKCASALRTALSQQPDNTSCKSVQKRLAAQQPATPEPVAWLDEMLADTREVFDAGGSETPQVVRDVIEYVKSWVTVYSEKNHPAPAAHPAPSVPATGEPVVSRNPFASRCYTMSESHLSGYRLIVGFEKLEDAQDAHEWVARQGRGDFTHPAPSVPGDVVRDAERYRWLRDHDHWPAPFSSSQEPEPVRGRDLDSNIDAAMLAAK